MKRKICAISLLLSFLMVLSHEMILHHHHESKALNLSVIHNQHAEDAHNHHHDSPYDKSEQKDSAQEHNHPLPFHHHILATNDFVFARTNLLESNPQNQISTLFWISDVFLSKLSEPPNNTINCYVNKTILLPTAFKPGAIALRGPPSIV